MQYFVAIQSLSYVQLFEIPWTAAHQTSLYFTTSQSFLKLMSIMLVMPSSHFSLCCPLLLLPSVFPTSGSFSMSQFFVSGGQIIGASASVLQWIFRVYFLQDWLVLFPCSPMDSQVFSNTTVQKHQIFWDQLSLWSNSHIHTWCWKNHSFDYIDIWQQSNFSAFWYVV